MSGNKTDNGVHEVGTDETLKAYQDDTPGQQVEKYLSQIADVNEARQKKHFSTKYPNPLKGYPYQKEEIKEEVIAEAKEFNAKKELADLKKLDKLLEKAYKDMNRLQYGKSLHLMNLHDGIIEGRRTIQEYTLEIERGNLDGPIEQSKIMKTLKEVAIDDTLATLQSEGTNLTDNPFRLGSYMYFECINEARKLVAEDRYVLTEVDKQIIETVLGEFEVYEGNMVPLDCPMIMEEEDKKDVKLNSPKVGGPKKYYVYVKDGDKIKKISWGDTTGLKVKLNNKKARASFVARHKCDTKNDKTTAGYWACRLPYYAKQLGLSGGGDFFWQSKYRYTL